jgi:FtsP/CotA-like multicopper oxidase with cupredoxin domain
MGNKYVSRRHFLGIAGLSAAALAARGMRVDRIFQGLDGAPVSVDSPRSAFLQPQFQAADVEINMRATPSVVPVLPGDPTQVLTYKAELVKGSPSNLITLPDNYLGPIIRVRQGQRLKVNFKNDLPEDTTVHFHGPCIPSNMGGHPHGTDVVHPGKTFIYEFDVIDRASPYWFHPHPDMRTAFQVYYGLAGLYLISDDLEAQVGLDTGEYDVPLVIQDRTFDANNQFVYLSGGMGMGMMGMMQGFLGNRSPSRQTRLRPNAGAGYIPSCLYNDSIPYRLFGGGRHCLHRHGWACYRHPLQRYVMLSPTVDLRSI